MTVTTMKHFDTDRDQGDIESIATPIKDLAVLMDMLLPDSEQKHIGLRKLLEARDCFIRASTGV